MTAPERKECRLKTCICGDGALCADTGTVWAVRMRRRDLFPRRKKSSCLKQRIPRASLLEGRIMLQMLQSKKETRQKKPAVGHDNDHLLNDDDDDDDGNNKENKPNNVQARCDVLGTDHVSLARTDLLECHDTSRNLEAESSSLLSSDQLPPRIRDDRAVGRRWGRIVGQPPRPRRTNERATAGGKETSFGSVVLPAARKQKARQQGAGGPKKHGTQRRQLGLKIAN